MAEEILTIKKIRTEAGDHLIDATYLGGHTFDQIESMVHGIVDTYVIPSSKKGTPEYVSIVENADNTINDVSKATLDTLIKNKPSNNEKYKVGDIILMEETSDGTKIFDRWISDVSEDGNTIALSILETQVATHHHTITGTSGKVLTGVSLVTSTAANVAKVGSAVDVLAGVAGDYVTSVDYRTDASGKGGHDLSVITTTTSTGAAAHSHTVNSHIHTVTFTPNTIVSDTANAYVSLSTSSHTPHTHSTQSVAGVHTNGSVLSYVYSGGTAEFIKTLKDSDEQTTGTNKAGLTTGSNSNGLNTDQVTASTVSDTVVTTSSGGHTHNVSVETTSSVVTDVTLATDVVTSVSFSFTAPTVQTSVVTSVSYGATKVLTDVTSNTSKFVNNWEVLDGGILTLTNSDAMTGITLSSTNVSGIKSVTRASQSVGSASLSYTSATQTYTSGKVSSTGSANEAGAHQHGFGHTHAIPSHTHSIASHTHTYVKSVASDKSNAYISLSTSSYTPHTHESVTVAATASNGSTLTYVYGGTQTSVVKNLLSTSKSCTVGETAPGTNTVYHKISGDITFPGLSVGTKSLETKSITPAEDSGEKAIKSITFTSANFIKTLDDNTGVNIGGNGE